MTYAGPIQAHTRRSHTTLPAPIPMRLCIETRAHVLWAELPRLAAVQAGPGARMAKTPAVPIGLAATDPAPGSTPVGGVAVYT